LKDKCWVQSFLHKNRTFAVKSLAEQFYGMKDIFWLFAICLAKLIENNASSDDIIFQNHFLSQSNQLSYFFDNATRKR